MRNPDAWCELCGREADECVCIFAGDIPDSYNPLDEVEDLSDYDHWGRDDDEDDDEEED